MSGTKIRVGTKFFTDVKRFPYGFRRSGDLSIVDSSILSTYGHILQSLALGSLEPESIDEKRFVEVSKGLVNPETAIEKAWLKYTQLTTTRKNFFTLHSPCFSITFANEQIEEFDNSDEEIEA
jgi:uncharacterized protein YifE (UPF0438 family)